MSDTNKSAQASATDRDSGGCAGVTCYAYAIVLLENLNVKKFQNREDFKNALDAIGDRPKLVLKWHDGAQQWTQPEMYA